LVGLLALTRQESVIALCPASMLVPRTADAVRLAAKPLIVAVSPVSGTSLKFNTVTEPLALAPSFTTNPKDEWLRLMPRMLNSAWTGAENTPRGTALTGVVPALGRRGLNTVLKLPFVSVKTLKMRCKPRTVSKRLTGLPVAGPPPSGWPNRRAESGVSGQHRSHARIDRGGITRGDDHRGGTDRGVVRFVQFRSRPFASATTTTQFAPASGSRLFAGTVSLSARSPPVSTWSSPWWSRAASCRRPGTNWVVVVADANGRASD